jgi:hypothetical protein
MRQTVRCLGQDCGASRRKLYGMLFLTVRPASSWKCKKVAGSVKTIATHNATGSFRFLFKSRYRKGFQQCWHPAERCPTRLARCPRPIEPSLELDGDCGPARSVVKPGRLLTRCSRTILSAPWRESNEMETENRDRRDSSRITRCTRSRFPRPNEIQL